MSVPPECLFRKPQPLQLKFDTYVIERKHVIGVTGQSDKINRINLVLQQAALLSISARTKVCMGAGARRSRWDLPSPFWCVTTGSLTSPRSYLLLSGLCCSGRDSRYLFALCRRRDKVGRERFLLASGLACAEDSRRCRRRRQRAGTPFVATRAKSVSGKWNRKVIFPFNPLLALAALLVNCSTSYGCSRVFNPCSNQQSADTAGALISSS